MYYKKQPEESMCDKIQLVNLMHIFDCVDEAQCSKLQWQFIVENVGNIISNEQEPTATVAKSMCNNLTPYISPDVDLQFSKDLITDAKVWGVCMWFKCLLCYRFIVLGVIAYKHKHKK